MVGLQIAERFIVEIVAEHRTLQGRGGEERRLGKRRIGGAATGHGAVIDAAENLCHGAGAARHAEHHPRQNGVT